MAGVSVGWTHHHKHAVEQVRDRTLALLGMEEPDHMEQRDRQDEVCLFVFCGDACLHGYEGSMETLPVENLRARVPLPPVPTSDAAA